jgi:hypothetical protein
LYSTTIVSSSRKEMMDAFRDGGGLASNVEVLPVELRVFDQEMYGRYVRELALLARLGCRFTGNALRRAVWNRLFGRVDIEVKRFVKLVKWFRVLPPGSANGYS